MVHGRVTERRRQGQRPDRAIAVNGSSQRKGRKLSAKKLVVGLMGGGWVNFKAVEKMVKAGIEALGMDP